MLDPDELQAAVRSNGVLRFESHFVESPVMLAFEAVKQAGSELRAVDQKADLGIDIDRAGVQVHRTDEQTLAIEHEHLGVQAGLG